MPLKTGIPVLQGGEDVKTNLRVVFAWQRTMLRAWGVR